MAGASVGAGFEAASGPSAPGISSTSSLILKVSVVGTVTSCDDRPWPGASTCKTYCPAGTWATVNEPSLFTRPTIGGGGVIFIPGMAGTIGTSDTSAFGNTALPLSVTRPLTDEVAP